MQNTINKKTFHGKVFLFGSPNKLMQLLKLTKLFFLSMKLLVNVFELLVGDVGVDLGGCD